MSWKIETHCEADCVLPNPPFLIILQFCNMLNSFRYVSSEVKNNTIKKTPQHLTRHAETHVYVIYQVEIIYSKKYTGSHRIKGYCEKTNADCAVAYYRPLATVEGANYKLFLSGG